MLRSSRYIVRNGRNTFVMWAPFRSDASLGVGSVVDDLPDDAEWFPGAVAPSGASPATDGTGVLSAGQRCIPDADESGWWIVPMLLAEFMTLQFDEGLQPLDQRESFRLFFRRMNKLKYFMDVT